MRRPISTFRSDSGVADTAYVRAAATMGPSVDHVVVACDIENAGRSVRAFRFAFCVGRRWKARMSRGSHKLLTSLIKA